MDRIKGLSELDMLSAKLDESEDVVNEIQRRLNKNGHLETEKEDDKL